MATDLGAPGGIVPAATFAEAYLLRSGPGLRVYGAHEVDVEPVATVDASRHAAGYSPEPPESR